MSRFPLSPAEAITILTLLAGAVFFSGKIDARVDANDAAIAAVKDERTKADERIYQELRYIRERVDAMGRAR